MAFPHRHNLSEEDYRVVRRTHLMHYCMVVKLKFPDAKNIVGIATDSGTDEYRSEDLVYYDASNWSEEAQAEAESIQEKFNLLKTVQTVQGTFKEYPDLVIGIPQALRQEKPFSSTYKAPTKIKRNDPCSCGSGAKYKRCHGK